MTVTANADGLRVRYGLDVQKEAQVGATCAYGVRSQLIAVLEVAQMDLTGGLIGGEPNSAIPFGSYILSATLIVTETFAGATGTLDLGLANADGTYTNLDEDGIDVAIAVAALLQGTVIACDGALVGAGTDRDTLALGYLSYDIDTVDFTAGKALLIVDYVTPVYPDQDAQ
jgi:hypothetical protein